MAVYLLLLVFVPIFLLFLLPNRRNYSKKFLHPPGPRGLPFIGNLHQFDSSAPHLYLWHLSQKYGPIMSMQLGSVPTLVVSSASIAKEIFKNHDLIFSNRPGTIAQQKISYNGLDMAFSPYNVYWREMRKLFNLHIFSYKSSQAFRPIREDEVARMIKKIFDGASSSKLINLSDILITLASSTAFRVIFGKRYSAEGNVGRRFHWLLAETQATFGSFFFSDYFPLMGRIIDKLNGASSRLEKSFKEMDEIYQQLIDEHISTADQNPSSRQENIIDIILELKREQVFSFDFTFDHIKALLMEIIVAGSDTSASLVVWAMTLLIKNPATMKKVQEEVRKLVGKKTKVDEDDLQKLVYLKAVVKETLRLYPPAPLLIPRETRESCVIKGYGIQAKTFVFVNPWAIGRDPESWKNPERFIPERFLNSTIDFKGQDFELLPFEAGRRICPGMFMGVATAELALANLLYSFDWELPHDKKSKDIDMNARPGLTMHKKNDLCLVVTPN